MDFRLPIPPSCNVSALTILEVLHARRRPPPLVASCSEGTMCITMPSSNSTSWRSTEFQRDGDLQWRFGVWRCYCLFVGIGIRRCPPFGTTWNDASRASRSFAVGYQYFQWDRRSLPRIGPQWSSALGNDQHRTWQGARRVTRKAWPRVIDQGCSRSGLKDGQKLGESVSKGDPRAFDSRLPVCPPQQRSSKQAQPWGPGLKPILET